MTEIQITNLGEGRFRVVRPVTSTVNLANLLKIKASLESELEKTNALIAAIQQR